MTNYTLPELPYDYARSSHTTRPCSWSCTTTSITPAIQRCQHHAGEARRDARPGGLRGVIRHAPRPGYSTAR